MRYRTCVLMTNQEITQQTGAVVRFENGKCNDKDTRISLEDFIGEPVIAIRDISTSEPDTVLIITAPGRIQDKTTLSRRMSILTGSMDTLKGILTDLIRERPSDDIFDIYDDYVLGCDAVTRNLIEEWLKDVQSGLSDSI